MTVNRLRRAVAPAALLLAVALGLAACAGSPRHRAAAAPPPSSAPSSSAAPSLTMPGMTTDPSPTGAPAAPVAGNAVTIQSFAFSPATLAVRVGTTVTWTNRDADAHTVTSQHGGPLRSAALGTGGSYSYTFTTPGTYPYLCTIHPFMTGTVQVTR